MGCELKEDKENIEVLLNASSHLKLNGWHLKKVCFCKDTSHLQRERITTQIVP